MMLEIFVGVLIGLSIGVFVSHYYWWIKERDGE